MGIAAGGDFSSLKTREPQACEFPCAVDDCAGCRGISYRVPTERAGCGAVDGDCGYRIAKAAEVTENKIAALPQVYVGDYRRAASLWAQLHDWGKATRSIKRGLQAYPGDPDLGRALDEVQAEARGSPVQGP